VPKKSVVVHVVHGASSSKAALSKAPKLSGACYAIVVVVCKS